MSNEGRLNTFSQRLRKETPSLKHTEETHYQEESHSNQKVDTHSEKSRYVQQFKRAPRFIKAKLVRTSFDSPSHSKHISQRPLYIFAGHQLATFLFGLWAHISRLVVVARGWHPRVEPYVGYGTEKYSRLICRTIYAPSTKSRGPLQRGIRSALMVPTSRTPVKISIDENPVSTVQIGTSELYDPYDPQHDQDAEFAISDTHGYLDLVAQGGNSVGVHNVAYKVRGRAAVHAPLYTMDSQTPVGVISDIDDTILVTNAPSFISAGINIMFRDPRQRKAVPGMSEFYRELKQTIGNAPFFYLSTSPWNIESTLRHFIRAQRFPEGPLLLRDFDPRPKTFIPSGVQHKLEFFEQLMEDFPHMRFILIGDDGQEDPRTYAKIVEMYPGRIIAIGIRQLEPRESLLARGIKGNTPMPPVKVPVFYGKSGYNLMKTMVPYLQRINISADKNIDNNSSDSNEFLKNHMRTVNTQKVDNNNMVKD